MHKPFDIRSGIGGDGMVPRRRVRAALIGLLLGVGMSAVGAPLAAGADQPWGFEQVTPTNKGAGVVSGFDTFQARPDGNALLYTAISPFDGLPAESAPLYTRYLGTRGPDSWLSRALDPPDETGTGVGTARFNVQAVAGASADLSHVLVASQAALTPGAIEGGGSLYMRNTSSGALTLVATSTDKLLASVVQGSLGATNVRYVASDGRSAQFVTRVPLVPGAPTSAAVLYSWSASDGIRVDSVLPDDSIVVPFSMAGGNEAGIRDPMPQASDGLDRVYFSPNIGGSNGPVYMRANGQSDVVSYSRIAPQPAPSVVARVDAVGGPGGRYLLFHTDQSVPLAGGEPVLSGNPSYLYRFDAVDDALEYVGAVPLNARIVQMTQDGRTVAFRSTFVLAPGAISGRQNMYVWRAGKPLQFVYAPDASSSGTNERNHLRRLSPKGRFLSFTDNSSSLAATFGGFNNVSAGCPVAVVGTPGPCDQVYRYDVEAAALSCASCRTDDAAPKGGSGDPAISDPGSVRLGGYQAQTVSDDGTVFFTSRDELVPDDGNGADDVYASSADGGLRLISRATQGTSARFLDSSADAGTVFLSTNDAIAETDTDREVDVYMTRLGAGFPYTPPRVLPPCRGSDCREGSAPLVQLPSAGSAGPGLSDSNPRSSADVRSSVRVVSATLKGSRLRLTVRVSSAGRIRASNAAFKTVSRTVRRAGTYTLSARLTKKTRAKLRRTRRLAAHARVSLSPPFGRVAVSTYRRTLRK